MAVIRKQKIRHLLQEIIDIYSPSGKEEEVLDFVYRYLTKEHLPVIRQEVDESRYNVIVVPPDTDPQLVLVGHLDTVTASDLDHYGFVRKGNTVTGLGSADMKGGCAAMIEAYLAVWHEQGKGTPAALALVVGEEETGDGAEAFVKDYYFPWAIIGEPTELKPCLSHYGYLEFQVSSRGKRRHASLADKELNPVDALLRFLLDLSTYFEKRYPQIIHNIRDLSSSRSGFAVPEKCDVWIDLHHPPDAPTGEITWDLEEFIDQFQQKQNHLDLAMRFHTIQTGYEIPEKGGLVTSLKQTFTDEDIPWTPSSFRSHSDANSLWESGLKPIMLGPGSLDQAHTVDESIPFDQVCKAAEVYYTLIKKV